MGSLGGELVWEDERGAEEGRFQAFIFLLQLQ